MKKNKLVCGWGINDVNYCVTKCESINGKMTNIFICPYYYRWKGIQARCYSSKSTEKRPTYKNCTVHEDWRYLSNFIKWVDSQPNRDWINCDLDKDLLIDGNKQYGPTTCVFVTKQVNIFIMHPSKHRGNYLLGTRKTYLADGVKYKYTAACSIPFAGRNRKDEYLGRFDTEIEAHEAWQAKKHEYACILANMRADPRVAKVLRERYAPDKDWTKV